MPTRPIFSKSRRRSELRRWGAPEDTGGALLKVGKAGYEEVPQEFKMERSKSTLMVNAAIMDESCKPVMAPWVVALPL